MHRFRAILACGLTLLAPAAAAHAHDDSRRGAPLPATHGADPRSVDRGPEAPGPAGGRDGSPLELPAQAAWAASGPAAKRRQARAVWASLPTGWCGDLRASDDREHELETGGARFHAVYAVPADGGARLGSVAPAIQTDTFRASALLEQLYGRAIRLDMGTRCGSQYLDISLVRLAETTADLERLGRTPVGTIDAVARALDQAGHTVTRAGESVATAMRRDRNYVVWLDGPSPGGSCGQATLYDDVSRVPNNPNNAGGKVAVIYREGTGFCDSNTVRHEMAHNLGALQRSAPNAFDGAHCDDAYEDTMCYSHSPRRGGGPFQSLYFDYGNDDYWDPAGGGLPFWTVNLSRFVCPDATCNAVGGHRELLARASVRIRRARRAGKARWRVSVAATGAGTGVVGLRCRPAPRRRSRTVLRRTLSLPGGFGARVRCHSRPRAVISQP